MGSRLQSHSARESRFLVSVIICFSGMFVFLHSCGLLAIGFPLKWGGAERIVNTVHRLDHGVSSFPITGFMTQYSTTLPETYSHSYHSTHKETAQDNEL